MRYQSTIHCFRSVNIAGAIIGRIHDKGHIVAVETCEKNVHVHEYMQNPVIEHIYIDILKNHCMPQHLENQTISKQCMAEKLGPGMELKYYFMLCLSSPTLFQILL
jgi:hypothetical protein